MTIMDKTRDVLGTMGNLLARALGLDGKASAVRSSGGLTSADDADAIMVAGSPGRRVAGSPGRRVAGSPGRRVAGSPNLRPRDGHERSRMAAPLPASVLTV